MKKAVPANRRAFSFVEMSVVLVILGLLVGGVLAGKSLIRASELRSVITQTNQYITAIQNFNSQYRGLPGDIVNASNYWSSAINGNGDGLIGDAHPIYESLQGWYQLNQAGFIEQSLTGAVGAGGPNSYTRGENIPATRIALGAFHLQYLDASNYIGTQPYYKFNYGNTLTIGAVGAGAGSGPSIFGLLNPTDAYTLDRKVDDGVPGTGNWIASTYGPTGYNPAYRFNGASSCTTDVNGSTFTGVYRTNIDVIDCAMVVKTGF